MKTRKTYILDTNVLIHDPESIFNFREHEVIVPFEALEELDDLKKRHDHKGYCARQTIRYLGDLIERQDVRNGLTLIDGGILKIDSAFLGKDKKILPDASGISGHHCNTDDRIIELVYYYKRQRNGNTVFVSKDINARIKAKTLGICTEDYKTDKTDTALIYSGHSTINVSETVIDEICSNNEIAIPKIGFYFAPLENQCLLVIGGSDASILAVHKGGKLKRINQPSVALWGMRPRNKEQQFAVYLLNDNHIHAVSLVGQAGTGKTMLALAVGLHKVLEEGVYKKIVMTKPVIPVGRQEIGFLPGDKEEKMRPWVQSIFDNFAFLSVNNQKLTLDYLMVDHLLEIESIAHIRGRSIAKAWIIVDESQNLTPHEMKTVMSRVGEGSKIVLTGDICQIDSPYLDSGSNGLGYLVSKFKGQPLFGHTTLSKTVRSPISSLAAELL